MRKYLLLFLFAAAVVNCTSFHGKYESNIPLNGKKIAGNLGETYGSDTTFTICPIVFFYTFGFPQPEKAIEEAISRKNGDALVNVEMTQKSFYFFLFELDTFKVKGEAVKFDASEKNEKVKRK